LIDYMLDSGVYWVFRNYFAFRWYDLKYIYGINPHLQISRMCNTRCGRHAIKDLIDKAIALPTSNSPAPVTPTTTGLSTPSKTLDNFIEGNAASAATVLGSGSTIKGKSPPTAPPVSGPSIVLEFIDGTSSGSGGGGEGAAVLEPEAKKPKGGPAAAATIPGVSGDGNGGDSETPTVPGPDRVCKAKKRKGAPAAAATPKVDGDEADNATLVPPTKKQKGKGGAQKGAAGSGDSAGTVAAASDGSKCGDKPAAATGANPLEMLDAGFMHALEAISGACGQRDAFAKLIAHLRAPATSSGDSVSSGSGSVPAASTKAAAAAPAVAAEESPAAPATAALPSDDEEFDLEVRMVRVTEH
jgi:hypothetical protein